MRSEGLNRAMEIILSQNDSRWVKHDSIRQGMMLELLTVEARLGVVIGLT